MKKLTVKKDVQCMACLECVRACSNAYFKEFDPDKACLQIVPWKGEANAQMPVPPVPLPKIRRPACT